MDHIDTEVDKIYSVFKSLELSENVFNSEADYLHQQRLQLDPFIFATLKKLYGTLFQEFWNTTKTIPYESDKAIVIVERRCHPNLEFILQNAAYFARGYTIYIYCSAANYSFIENICIPQLENIHICIVFDDIGTPKQGKEDYNRLLKEKFFWNTIKEEHILTIETDCYLLKPIPDLIYDYDYVASMWNWLETEPGGGGLSYRKCSVMKTICDLDEPSVKGDQMQDSFASNGIKFLDKKFSHEFFTESTFSENSIGTHQWWTFLDSTKPNAKDIIKKHLILRV